MQHQALIEATQNFVQETLKDAESGHDWWHILRVYNNAKHIAAHEDCDLRIVELGALLHDIADSKFHHGDEEVGPKKAAAFLNTQNVSPHMMDQVVYIIRNISFKNTVGGKTVDLTPELAIVMDADRLDAIGAIGIARTFNYGGFKNRELYNPDIPPMDYADKKAYQKSDAPTINHFYEKLLKLKDQMNTATGTALAQERHAFMETYLQQFYREWNGE